jgi:Zn-finger nucleic acid-binding protein
MEAPIGERVLACMSCGGVWMDGAAYKKMASQMESEVLDLAELATSHAERRGATIPQDSANACPDCSISLTRTTRSGVTLDVCKDHGVWFDRGELQALAARVRGEESKRETSRPPPITETTNANMQDLKKTVAATVAFEGALNLITLFF